MNRLDDCLDDIIYNADMVRIGLVVPNPHKSPCLLFKVPPCLDHPVVVLVLFSLHPVYGFQCVRIVFQVLYMGVETAERTAPTRHPLQRACHKTDTGRLLPRHKGGSTVSHGDRVGRNLLVRGISAPA
jgi:hypothetical protein